MVSPKTEVNQFVLERKKQKIPCNCMVQYFFYPEVKIVFYIYSMLHKSSHTNILSHKTEESHSDQVWFIWRGLMGDIFFLTW